MIEPPISIQKGLRLLSTTGTRLISPPNYFDQKFAKDKWAFEVEIPLGISTEENVNNFPAFSRWFVVVDHCYPLGDIEVFPSKEGGISETHQHQSYNNINNDDLPWKMGKICVDYPIQRLGIVAGYHDPVGDYEERIRWHLWRALDWMKAVATGTIIEIGQPYERPYYPCSVGVDYLHDEGGISFSKWKNISKTSEWGFVIWDNLEGLKNSVFAVAYFYRNGELVRATPKYDETIHILHSPNIKQGLWWLWPLPVVLEPWQVPINWGELRKIGNIQRVQVDQFLHSITKVWRGHESTPLMIGYPIPQKYGDEPYEIDWQVLMLPKMLMPTTKKKKPPPGFRTTERYLWWHEKTMLFGEKEQLSYMETHNWHPDRLQARGRFSRPLREARLALIGCGALGSLIGEQLVRGGVGEILFIDKDKLEGGNLVRHTLSCENIGEYKADALVNHYKKISPFASFIAKSTPFPKEVGEITTLLEDYDIVIDTTAEDEVIRALALGWWGTPKIFFSISVGYKAKRTFIFSYQGQSFPFRVFQSLIEPLLKEERTQIDSEGGLTEGAGCWSPLFPARIDDLMLSSSSAIKMIEEQTEGQPEVNNAKLTVFEQVNDIGFQGIKRMELINTDG